MKFLLEKLYEIKNIKIKELIIWSLIGVATLQLNNMWNILATKINSGKEISFLDLTWWKEEIWSYSLTPNVIGISIAGIFWMNFIQVGATNYIWSNIKKSLLPNDQNDEQKILMKHFNKVEKELQQLREKYDNLSSITNAHETKFLLTDEINNKENNICVNFNASNNTLTL